MSEQQYGIEDLRNKVTDAVMTFAARDPLLLQFNAHEQAMAHRIAIYLECQFEGDKELNFDCEYNKHLKGPKEISLDRNDLLRQTWEAEQCWCAACQKIVKKEDLEKLDDKLFRPDIVAHSRGNDDRNLIAIEIKKTEFCPFDAAKLKALTIPRMVGGKYGYQLGVLIIFPKGEPLFKWFLNGNLVLK